MSSIGSIDNVQSTFSNLKKDGLIDKNHTVKKIRPRQDSISFRGLRFPSRRIAYTGDCDSLSEDELRYILLHEEYHLKFPQQSRFYKWLLAILIVPPILYLLYTRIIGSGLGAIDYLILFLYVFVLILLPRIFREPLLKDEIEADSFSAGLLKSKYGIEEPSIIVRKALNKISETTPNKKRGSDFLLFLGMDIHPSRVEREKLVRERVDSS
jgi:Zn-dependent protease with chaperone function